MLGTPRPLGLKIYSWGLLALGLTTLIASVLMIALVGISERLPVPWEYQRPPYFWAVGLFILIGIAETVIGSGLLRARRWAHWSILGVAVLGTIQMLGTSVLSRGRDLTTIPSLVLWLFTLWYFLRPSLRVQFYQRADSLLP